MDTSRSLNTFLERADDAVLSDRCGGPSTRLIADASTIVRRYRKLLKAIERMPARSQFEIVAALNE